MKIRNSDIHYSSAVHIGFSHYSFIHIFASVLIFLSLPQALTGQGITFFRNAEQLSTSSIISFNHNTSALTGNPATLSVEQRILGANIENRFGTDILAASLQYSFPIFTSQSLGLMIGSYGVEGYRTNRISTAYTMRLSDKLRLGAQFNFYDTRIILLPQQWRLTTNIGLVYSIMKTTSLNIGISELQGGKQRSMMKYIGIIHRVNTRFNVLSELRQASNEKFSLSAAGELAIVDIVKIRFSVSTDDERIGYGILLQLFDSLRLNLGGRYHQSLDQSFGLSLEYIFK